MVEWSGKYGYGLIIAALVSLSLIIFFFIDVSGSSGLAREFCLSSGHDFETRFYQGESRGYCLFDTECLIHGFNDSITKLGEGVVSNQSDCLATDFYNGSCLPCQRVFRDCSAYKGVEVCFQEVMPVCARIRVNTGGGSSRLIERTIGNACTACVNSRSDSLVTGYVKGNC